ncbi:MAG: alpha/beta hydrolase [Roseiflexaceae bacterium]|nr:alpha/beta hydrolase [Roseiflexaceae bacterium]
MNTYVNIELRPRAPGVQDEPPGARAALTMLAPPPERATGAAIIVCPGGGYVMHAEHEAEPLAEWLCELGITAFILRYRLHPQHKHPAALDDLARAVRVVRAKAGTWGIDPQRIGTLGFSAGGHLVSMLATLAATEAVAADPELPQSAQPDLQILIYPVINLQSVGGHEWCGEALFGPAPTPELLERFSTHLNVSPQTPPAFLMHAADDSVSCAHSLLYAAALQAHGVPFALHIAERGGHGFGMGQSDPLVSWWPERCAAWLGEHGFAALDHH